MLGPRVAWLTLVPLLPLTACGGGTDSSLCNKAFPDAETFLLPSTAACPDCSIENARRMIDGDGESAARLTFNSGGASPAGSLSLDIVRGGRFASGDKPGAYVTFPTASFAGISISFTTYLDGEKQEDVACSPDDGSSCNATFGTLDGAGSMTFYGGAVNKSFDQLNMTIAVEGAPANTTVLVHEACASQ